MAGLILAAGHLLTGRNLWTCIRRTDSSTLLPSGGSFSDCPTNAAAHRVDGVVDDADETERNGRDEHPSRHGNAEQRPVDVAALTATGHDLADHLEQRKHLQQVIERRTARRHRARWLVLDPDMAPCDPGGGHGGDEDQSRIDDGAV